jgi:ribonucleoside-triphosphate reductase
LSAPDYLVNPYQQFIHTSRYARFSDDLGRRENYTETVGRYVDFMVGHLKKNNNYTPDPELVEKIRLFILDQKTMPSMRALMTAGPALERNNISGYNCAYLPIEHPRCFDETLYILMNGTGVGYSVEQSYVKKMPEVSEHFERTDTCIHVEDSKEGWAKGLRELIALLWAGQVPSWNLDDVRPAGARLKVFGGRASGPAPLDDLFRFTVNLFQNAAGRKLTSIEAHDLICKIASVVVVGGVRRAALICLSDLSDQRMALAKSGQWWETEPQRQLANNSVAYTCKPDVGSFMREWVNLYESKSGERGVFNRQASKKQAAKNGRRDSGYDFGTNPCSEIILRPYQFCNLTTVVIREDDDFSDVAEKVELSAILGTWQSTLTNFKYLRKVWKKNTEEERLLGVSMTGQLGHKLFNGQEAGLEDRLTVLKEHAVKANCLEAEKIGIPQSAAVTCVKPEGTASQLVGVSSGMTPWHDEYFVRTVRADKKDPLTQFLIDNKIPYEDSVSSESDVVFEFPQAAPKGALTRNSLSAIDHLELWLTYQRYWCEHKPSVTINVKENEWMMVGAWVYDHFDEVSGVSFLPYSDHIYRQAPYQTIDQDEYSRRVAEMPDNIRWADMVFYESSDNTTGSQELACVSGVCDVVDLVK